MQLKFKREARFDSCKIQCHLPFDFIVKLKNKIGFLIEFHGEQHYSPVRWFGSIDQEKANKLFESSKVRDKIKEEWAAKRNIPLLIIPYNKIKQIPELIQGFVNELNSN